MAGKKNRGDPRLDVARYQVDQLAGVQGETADDDDTNTAGQASMDQRTQFVEISIVQAMRRGDFDDLPGSGKPLRNLHEIHDPNWWIRKKIERESLTGLGPPALTLRTEDAALGDRMDAAPSEGAVRELLKDFNARVVEARRQLQGGPPVVTQLRDVEAEVAAWRDRRDARYRAAVEARERERAERAAMTWRQRRRAKRGR
ncbi:DUF1992 domain-containing protein [Diaminobutyricibacter sp. McL0608]|uniref:DnaJ family domain-containing protein n=1 Tax=Leifsonia sp. McL0608 TaxID=3143537 RepID=UPI0031F32186